MLGDISPVGVVQADLLEPVKTSDTKLMSAIDGLNSRFGRGTIKVSSWRATCRMGNAAGA